MKRRIMQCLYRRIVVLGLLAALLSSMSAAAAPPQVTGSLETVNGVRVLKLWGPTAYKRGYAHGYLLGSEIVGLLESALLDPRMLEDPKQYETSVRQGFLGRMTIDPERREELQGMFDGIAASAEPAAIQLNRLGRQLDVRDLEAVNTAADWYRFMCSSFSAWGDGEGGNEMITARNLDFMTLPGLDTRHLIIAYVDAGPNRKRWVSLAWPGLIGAYTAMNEDGVTISIHDAQGRKPPTADRFVARSFALRDALEVATAAGAVSDVRRVLSRKPSICGNNVHVSAPFTNQPQPAAIFEYDGDVSTDSGVTCRLAQASGEPAVNWLACTNHYLQRTRTVEGVWQDSLRRYDTIEKALRRARQSDKKIDLAYARKVMSDVGVKETLQSVVFFPNRRELYVSLATPGLPATSVEPTRFLLEDLLRR